MGQANSGYLGARGSGLVNEALAKLLQARTAEGWPEQWEFSGGDRLGRAISAVHEVLEPRSLPLDCPVCGGTGVERTLGAE